MVLDNSWAQEVVSSQSKICCNVPPSLDIRDNLCMHVEQV
jgi:hypothetical protein